MAARVVPTGVERPMREDQQLISKADLAGNITYGNDDFVEVSGYSRARMIGSPHSLIRHPEMPRGVFAHLWDSLNSGRDTTMCVCNLAADGGHFWVLEQVFPTKDVHGEVVGYHAIRRKADRVTVKAVVPLYRRMLQSEQAADSPQAAVEAGRETMREWLSDWGQTYLEFIWNLVNASEQVPFERTLHDIAGTPLPPVQDVQLARFQQALPHLQEH